MERIIVDDNASALYMLQLKQRLDEIEDSGIGKDEEGNVATIKVDQVVKSGTEIGGVTVGTKRTPLYAPAVEIPEAEKVTVTTLVDSGTRIANIKIGSETKSIFAPNSETVTVTPVQTSGTRIATIKVGNNTQTLYAPEVHTDGSGSTIDISGKLDAPARPGIAGQVLATNGQGVNYWTTVSSGGGDTIITGDGDTPMPLLNEITLTEDVSSIIISQDSTGKPLNIASGFYIETNFEPAATDKASRFNVSIGSSDSATNVLISANHSIYTDRITYGDIYAKQIAPNRWLVETRVKTARYETASGVGTAVGQLAYSNWNGSDNPPAVVNRIVLSYNTNNFGKNTKIKIYGR